MEQNFTTECNEVRFTTESDEIQKYIDLIKGWASERNLIRGSTPVAQLAKLVEEVGEIAAEANSISNIFTASLISSKVNPNLVDDIIDRLKDGIGDAIVVAVILQAQYEEMGFDTAESFSTLLAMDQMGSVHFESVNLQLVLVQLLETLGSIAGNVARKKPILSEDCSDLYNFLLHLANLSSVTRTPIIDCISRAWNDIKDRKGRMIDGVFVKESDLPKD